MKLHPPSTITVYKGTSRKPCIMNFTLLLRSYWITLAPHVNLLFSINVKGRGCLPKLPPKFILNIHRDLDYTLVCVISGSTYGVVSPSVLSKVIHLSTRKHRIYIDIYFLKQALQLYTWTSHSEGE